MARRTVTGARSVVTGATSGIGQALALELARRGAKLIVTGRREERLAALTAELKERGGEVEAVVGDIADARTRQTILQSAQERWHGLDILINNAGVGAVGPFAEASPERLRRIMEVNFFAPAEFLREALPLLRQGSKPIVVNVSSVLGHRAVPNKSEYCASKFALHGLSDALRSELKPDGIDVLLVSPSTTQSEFFDHVLENTAATKSLGRAMRAETVACKTIRAIERGQHEIILSVGGKLLVWLDRLSPPLANWLVERFG